MKKKEPFKEFNLAENNPDQSGIMYTLRYTPERIDAHREQVVSALDSLGISFEDRGEFIAAVPKNNLSESEMNRTYHLLEELSVLNEATEYVDAGFGKANNVGDLKDMLMSSYFHFVMDDDIVDKVNNAYNLVVVVIPRIVNDIEVADEKNDVLYSQERYYLSALSNFARKKSEYLNNPRKSALFRS